MNKPSSMYKLKRVFELPEKLELPTCMYKMKNPVACVTDHLEKKENGNEVLNGILEKEPLPGLQALEAKWDGLLNQLIELKSQIGDIKKTLGDACKVVGYTMVDSTTLNNLKAYHGAVIKADPTQPPYFLLLLKHLIQSSVPLSFVSHVHSSLSNLPDNLKCFQDQNNDQPNALKFYLIWKNDLLGTELVTNPIKQSPIKGEVNILRLLARSGLKMLQYPSDDLFKTTEMDSILDICHQLVHSSEGKERKCHLKSLSDKLGSSNQFGDGDYNIVDVSAWSALKQTSGKEGLSPNLKKWYDKIDKILF